MNRAGELKRCHPGCRIEGHSDRIEDLIVEGAYRIGRSDQIVKARIDDGRIGKRRKIPCGYLPIVEFRVVEIDLDRIEILGKRTVCRAIERLGNDRRDLRAKLEIEYVAIAVGSILAGLERIVGDVSNRVDTLSRQIHSENFNVVEIIWKRLREPRDDDPAVGRVGKVEVFGRDDDIRRDSC